MIGTGYEDRLMPLSEAGAILEEALCKEDFDDKSVLIIVPDNTRSGPLPWFFERFCELLLPRVKRLDFLVALGTHAPLSEESLMKLMGISPAERAGKYADVGIYNHLWENPETFRKAGTISAGEIEAISGGLMSMKVPVTVNKMVFDYDRRIIMGPVFPHEVVGFSGGHKYYFPGIAGRDIIDFTHWLGATITSMEIIGRKDTPVRKVIEKAAGIMGLSTLCICPVVKGEEDLAGVFAGGPYEAWEAAADLSARVHILYVDKPYKQVLSVMPEMYEDIWTGAKGMYKLEPVIADGGEVIIYAPHITEVSYVHGENIDKAGYHVRDYFLKQWDKFKNHSWCVLAHSTHLRGTGTFENGVENPRIKVTLATGIPQERCEKINLYYRDPASINLEEWKNKENQGVLLVPRAGEMLYRLKSANS